MTLLQGHFLLNAGKQCVANCADFSWSELCYCFREQSMSHCDLDTILIFGDMLFTSVHINCDPLPDCGYAQPHTFELTVYDITKHHTQIKD